MPELGAIYVDLNKSIAIQLCLSTIDTLYFI